jgi:hypothetical protein
VIGAVRGSRAPACCSGRRHGCQRRPPRRARAGLSVRGHARRDPGGRQWRVRPPLAPWLICWCPDRPAAGAARGFASGQGCGSRARPFRLCWAPPGWLQERRYQGCPSIRRRTQATAGHAEPSLGCYVLRGWRVSPRGMHRGRGRWAEGRQGHVGGGEAPQGPPALAHRHCLGLRGERARSARAAGITGGCHGPRVDRARPGSPYRRRKPPAGHPQLAGPPRPRQQLPRPGIGFPAPAGGYPAGRCPGLPARSWVSPAARAGVQCPVVTWLPGRRLRSP